MKKNIIITIALLMSMSSCDYLDVTPPYVITDEQVFSSESGILAALTSIYINLPAEDIRYDMKGFGGDSYWLNIDLLVGHAINRKGDDVVASEGFNGSMGADWFYYGTVRSINKFILNIQNTKVISQGTKKLYEAEALVLRAWCYYAMAKRYGGVPIVDKLLEYDGPESIPGLELPRASEQETWDFILSDIDAAIENGIPETNQDGRVTKYAALTIKAQAALHAASIAKFNDINWEDSNTGKLVCGIPSSEAEKYYKIVEAACDSIILSGNFELARSMNSSNKSENFRLMFLNPKSHKETILAKYFSYPDLVYMFDNFTVPWGRYTNPSACPTVDLIENYEYLDGRPGTTNIPSVGGYSNHYKDRTDFFMDRDARLLGTVMIPGETFQGFLIDVKYGEINSNGSELTTSRYRGAYGMGADTQTPSSMFRKKHVNDSKMHSLTGADSEQPYILMRYAEVLLMAAEAKVEMGKAEQAKKYINDIRTRAGLKEIDVVTREEVRRQFTCEMAYENKTFWNYRRWRIHDTIMGSGFQPRGLFPLLDTRVNEWVYKVELIGKGDMFFQKHFYYNHINIDEMRKNRNLCQNFGY